MTTVRFGAISALALSLAFVACDRSDPPSKQLERAAEDAIGEVQGENLPSIARGPFAPRNECLDQPGASAFLLTLRNAVEARDSDALLALAADDIKLDFGGGAGTDLLRERLADDNRRLWDELDEIMTLGCASDGALMTMPWYFAQDISIDPYMGGMVMGEDISLFASPSEDAEVMARISWDFVEAQEGLREGDEYAKVVWINPEGKVPTEGFIDAEKLRSAIDYRLIATRRNDRWRITNFIAGD